MLHLNASVRLMQNKKTTQNKNVPLRRVYKGAVVSGVLNGIAIKLNFDVTLLRILFLLLTLFSGGIVIVLYILMYLIIPSEKSKLESNVSGSRMLKLALAILLGIFVIVFLLDTL